MYSITGKTMLVTGGNRGMGKLFCEHGVAEGAKIIIWATNEQTMKETAEELTRRGGEVYTYNVDVSDRRAIEKAAENVLKEHGTVDILINNAGIVASAYFWEHTNDQIEKTMHINSGAQMYICRAFLPGMMEKREGRIVNMASAAGLISSPKMSVYCASKWAVNGWSDSLRLELEQEGYSNICVTTVTPGYVNTGMFEGAKAPLMTPILEPEPFVQKVWESMKKGKMVVRSPWTIYLVASMKGILPIRLFDFIFGRIFGVYKSMDEFKGH
ncbi:MAG: SDR family NAD(P)-dependent oxidoreductase [Gammaproteobacteria bacterium]|nr:MAG: SDR family NAD(P)-dependent oxidoreductase [Gammaproteobacteria bacterium]